MRLTQAYGEASEYLVAATKAINARLAALTNSTDPASMKPMTSAKAQAVLEAEPCYDAYLVTKSDLDVIARYVTSVNQMQFAFQSDWKMQRGS